jgi:Tol biopolymer transport system component
LYLEGTALWSVAVQNGQAAGAPTMVTKDLGGTPIGMTSSGLFYYNRSAGGGNYIYVTGREANAATPLTFAGLSAVSDHQGRRVAFVRGGASDDLSLIVRSLENGSEQSFLRAGLTAQSPVWLHDGSGLIVTTAETNHRTFLLLDLASGTFRHLVDQTANGKVRTGDSALSPDDRTLYLGVRASSSTPVTGIIAVDMASGAERPVFTFPANAGPKTGSMGIAVSPDGTRLALRFQTGDAQMTIAGVNVDGTGFSPLVAPFRGGWPDGDLLWTGDGRDILFIAGDANFNWQVMRVSAAGGAAVLDGISFETLAPVLPAGMRMWPGNFNSLSATPDGSRLITSTLTYSLNELWTLDNLTSALSAR